MNGESERTHYDVIVAGGGLAGLCAAVGAARAGADTLLIEKAPCAGGIATNSLEPSICNFFRNRSGEFVLQGAPLELIGRLADKGAASPRWADHRGHIIFDLELGKLAMDEMLEEAGVDILYDSLVVGANATDGHVNGVTVANRSGLTDFTATCYVDATGDNDLAHYAGAPMRYGGIPHSFLFRLGNVDLDAFVQYIRDHPEEHFTHTDIGLSLAEALRMYDETGIYLHHHWASKHMKLVQEPIARGEYSEKFGPFYHMDVFQMHGLRANRTLVVNTGIFDMAEPEGRALSYWLRQGRKMSHHVAVFMRRQFPGCADSFIVATANAPGIRRTRWLQSDFTLTREMYDSAPRYADAIGRGVLMTEAPMHPTDRTFDISLRCLLPIGLDNVIIGSGRGASCDPAELLRVMPITMAVGHGAGVTAAMAARSQGAIRDVSIADVQGELRRQDVNI